MVAVNVPQKYITLEWGRGTGKSTIMGWYIKEIITRMPRCKFIISGSSYKDVLRTTLPSTKEGLEMFGIKENIHYVINKRGPKHWDLPYQSPNEFGGTIHFCTGALALIVSQDSRGGGNRGSNTDAVLADEAAKQNKDQLYYDCQATNRGNLHRHGHVDIHHTEILCSTTPLTAEGMWFIEMEKEAILNPNKYAFISATAELNRHNLGDDWFERMKANSVSPLHYNAEVLNIRPPKVENSFYPSLKPSRHYYRRNNNSYLETLQWDEASKMTCESDGDLTINEPLILSLDYGARINTLTVQQRTGNEHRCLKEFYVKHPEIIDDLFEQHFIPYYAPHHKKVIYLWDDPQGNKSQAGSRVTLFEQIERILKKHNWKVQRMGRGVYPPMSERFILWNAILSEKDPRLPKFRVNKDNCPNLCISLENAPSKEGPRGIEKDKSSERNKSIQQEHATHFSDGVDYSIHGMYWKVLRNLDREFMDFNVLK